MADFEAKVEALRKLLPHAGTSLQLQAERRAWKGLMECVLFRPCGNCVNDEKLAPRLSKWAPGAACFGA
eukprot:2303832-Amphidinium_carterae.1